MIYNLSNQTLSVKINAAGAEIVSIVKRGAEYIKTNFDILDGWAFNLFPIIGRLNQGVYTYQGETFKIPKNGFLRKALFDVTAREKDSIALEFKYNDYTLKMYPFKFSYTITYTLKNNTVKVDNKITNLDDKPIYFCVGAKPGFNVPISDQLDFSDYYIEFEQAKSIKRLCLDSSFLLNGKFESLELMEGNILPLRHKMFDNDALILSGSTKSIALKSNYDSKSVKISYPDMSYIALWKPPRTETPLLCIEGWTGLPSYKYKIDDIQTKENIIKLDVKENYTNAWTIEIN